MRLGLSGFEPHPWQSVDRTRQFYLRALSTTFDLDQFHGFGATGSVAEPDAILNFAGGRCWEFDRHPDCPLVFALHGGTILNQDFLYSHLAHLETTDVLIVNCTSDLAILRQLFMSETPQLCLLPLPVDAERFQPIERRLCRAQLPIEQFDYVIGFVARLIPQKNLHQFLYILDELTRRLHPYNVAGIIVGDYWVDYPILNYATGDYHQFIAELIDQLGLAKAIAYFPAQLSDEVLALCYSAMDVLIHPTNAIDENFGYAPIEAMACGTPVIGAAYGGLKDTIVSGETGFLMPTWITTAGIRMDLIQGLDDTAELLTNRPLWRQMSEASVRRAREHYNEQTCANMLCSAVRRAVAERQTGHARPITLAARRPEPRPPGSLPPIKMGWERYQDVVAYYVSGDRPMPSPRSRLRLAAPMVATAAGGYRLVDPAWPAEFRLDQADCAIVERCKEVIAVAELMRQEGVDLARVARLIDNGLLLCTD